MWKSFQSLRQSNLLSSILPLLLLMCSCRVCAAKPNGGVCEFNGQRYRVGETFHPRVLPVEDKCVNCSCLQGGEVTCQGTECDKPNCVDPVYVAGECCPLCNVQVEKAEPQATPPPGCDYDGSHYEEGEEFPSNKTGFMPSHRQCVLCQCFRSRVYCHVKKCVVRPNCIRTVTVSNDCCQQCAEYIEDPKPPKEGRVKPGDCLSTLGPQKNGTTWKPVVGQYGAMECVACKCLDGRVDCHRVQCPAKSSYKCKRPQLRRGKCCRECPKKIRTQRKVTRKDGKKKKKCKKDKGGQRKKRKGKKKKKRCKKSNKKSPSKQTQTTTTTSTSSSNSGRPETLGNVTMNTDKDKLCVNKKKADFVVYILREDNSFSLVLDNVKSDGTSEKADWNFHKGFIVTSRKSPLSPNSPIRKAITTRHLAGTSITRNVKKFFKVLEKKLQKCKKRCRRKVVEKTFKRLRIKSVNLKKSC